MMRHRLLAMATTLSIATAIPTAVAAQQPYIDDRSSPEALIRSLYNAINRQEYARAYSYFSEPPAETLEAYAEGYADTERIELTTGAASSVGAAGSTFYSLPVAIRASQDDGSFQLFAGCYEMRLANPTVQGAPFTPLHIESGQLSPAEGEAEEALPASCGDAPPPEAADVALKKAERLFREVYSERCPDDGGVEDQPPQQHLIRFRYAYEAPEAEETQVRLFRFFCDSGAYNELHVYLMEDPTGQILPLRFAKPELVIRHENDDPEGAVEEIRITGYRAEDTLVNSSFDPDTLEIRSNFRWRGLGDASEAGIWLFRDGAFSLVRYEVDASYDGEVNPELMLDYYTGP